MTTFETSRTILASPQAIFESFKNPKKLATWWGPTGFSNTFNVFQFYNGGTWSFVMHAPDGTQHPNENQFIEIVDDQKVVIEHLFDPKFVLTITISGDETASVVNWCQVLACEDTAKKIAHIIIPSNEQNLDRLTEVTVKARTII